MLRCEGDDGGKGEDSRASRRARDAHTDGRTTLEEGTMRCICLLKHDGSAAARTAGAMASISLSTEPT